LMSTLESLRRRLAGPGTIRIKSSIVQGMRETVRIDLRLERSGQAAWTPFVFPFESESSHLEISVAHAIITAAGGRLGYVQSWANAAEIEILLPRSTDPMTQISHEKGVVLLVGSGTEAMSALKKQFENDGNRVIHLEDESQALLVASFHEGDIAAVVADINVISPGGRERLELAFLDRNSNTKFIWRHLATDF